MPLARTPAGKRQHLVTWQRPLPPTDDEYGDTTDDWETVLAAWCKMEAADVGTTLAAQQVEVSIKHKIIVPVCRALAELQEGWRGVYQGRFLEVTGCRLINEDREFEALCTEAPHQYGPGGALLRETGVDLILREDSGMIFREG